MPLELSVGAEFDVLAEGDVLVKLAEENRLSFAHFKLPCQTMTWARSLPVRPWDSIWTMSGLSGLPLERVQVSNQLLMFTMQHCVLLHEASSYFSVGIPESCWTWAFAVVAFVHTNCQVWP